MKGTAPATLGYQFARATKTPAPLSDTTKFCPTQRARDKYMYSKYKYTTELRVISLSLRVIRRVVLPFQDASNIT